MIDFEPRHLNERREDEYHHQIEIRDGNGNFMGEVGDYSDLEWILNADAESFEASQMTLPGSSIWAKTFMRANMKILLVHVFLYRGDKLVKQWTGRVDRSVRTKEGPQGTIRVELISDKGWYQYLHIWSAPFSPLWVQIPKQRIKMGPAIYIMKQFMTDNLLRLQSNANVLELTSNLSLYQNRPHLWPTIQQHMYPVIVVPTVEHEDKSPFSILTARMDSAGALIGELCKDNNLLATARFHVPGRDPAPPRVTMTRPGVVLDIIDKDKARARGTRPDIWQQIGSVLDPFFRGMFGRWDVPPVMDASNIDDLRDFFGKTPNDPWVIFRDSPKHWNQVEVSSYSPTTYSTIAGGKSHDFLNKGINLLVNSAIQFALSLVGVGFLGNLITGELDDLFFAYQKADDPNLREFLGDFTFHENYEGQGTTAFSFDSSQALRSARWNAIGYKTAVFTADAASFPPFRPFEDFDILDPIGWEDPDEDRIIPDRLKEITVREDASGINFEIRIGESDRPEEPWAIQQRRNARFKQAIDAAFMTS